jgi:hypothetical protein
LVVIEIVHELAVATVQFDVHPANFDNGDGVAVRVTIIPCGKVWPQTVPPATPQLRNGAVPFNVETLPVPDPSSKIDKVAVGGVGAVVVDDKTVTLTDAVITEPLVVVPIAVMVGE